MYTKSRETLITVKSPFNVMSRFKVQNDVTKMEFHIKKYRFSVKSQFSVNQSVLTEATR